ncbi:MAG: glycosyltransferase [Phycisphaeraceae bacterium]
MARRILFGTSSWGLGHATRDLVLIRALLEAGCEVTVVATGPALKVLRGELGERCDYLDWPDMPSTISRSTIGFYVKTISFIPRIFLAWFDEKRRLRKLLRDRPIDVVISDHRYGLVTDAVPCFFISHSPRYIAPWRSWFMETCMELFVAAWLRPAEKLLVPDHDQRGLSGDMSHKTRFFPREKMVFLGQLSSLSLPDDPPGQDIDTFISISGPEPQRTRFQAKVLGQLGRLKGRTVVTLGLPGREPPRVKDVPANVEIHAYLGRAEQQRMMLRSRLVVCRSGYTTLMELAELGRPALLVPTPAQTEQLYLAKTLREQGLFHSVKQSELDLSRDIPLARERPGYQGPAPTRTSAERFLETVLEVESAGVRGS